MTSPQVSTTLSSTMALLSLNSTQSETKVLHDDEKNSDNSNGNDAPDESGPTYLNVIISPKISSQYNDLIIKEFTSLCEIYWNLDQTTTAPPPFELQFLDVISHDNFEVSTQELRILANPQDTNNGNNNNSNNNNNNGHENRNIVLYLGMANGVIQKHKLKLVNI